MAQIDLRNATIYLLDGSSTPKYIEIIVGEGNLNYNESRNFELVKSRGKLDTVREGDEEGVDVTFTFIWEFITGSGDTEITIEDALKNRGNADDWISTSPDENAPFCLNIQIAYIPPCSSVDREYITFTEFHYQTLGHSLRDGTIDCRGKCNRVEATAQRTGTEE